MAIGQERLPEETEVAREQPLGAGADIDADSPGRGSPVRRGDVEGETTLAERADLPGSQWAHVPPVGRADAKGDAAAGPANASHRGDADAEHQGVLIELIADQHQRLNRDRYGSDRAAGSRRDGRAAGRERARQPESIQLDHQPIAGTVDRRGVVGGMKRSVVAAVVMAWRGHLGQRRARGGEQRNSGKNREAHGLTPLWRKTATRSLARSPDTLARTQVSEFRPWAPSALASSAGAAS